MQIGAGAIPGRRRPGQFVLSIAVHPRTRGQGLGKQLYWCVREFAVQHGATTLTCTVPEDEPWALQFAQALGFTTERHEFESTIELDTWREKAYADKLAAVESLGIRFFAYADEPCEEALYELVKRNSVDLPGLYGLRWLPAHRRMAKTLAGGPGHAVGLYHHRGRRQIAGRGNSDGEVQQAI